MKKINELIDCDYNIEIEGITDDSREVHKNFLFVTTKGFNCDHYDYINSAIKNGCCFIITDREIEIDFPHLIVDNINECYRELCIKFYDVNIDDNKYIGITGTDGKTTTATILSEIINSAYIGTNGLKVNNITKETSNTTPCISDLYEDISFINKNNCNLITMEVSSEALLHDRVKDLKFDIVAFTNITGDHLNVHKTFDNYVKSKFKLLDLVKDNGYVVINGDDKTLQNIKCKNVVSFGFDKCNDFVIENVNQKVKYTYIDVKYNDNLYCIVSPFKGKYNVYNVVCAFVMALLYGIDSRKIINKIKRLEPVKGRCEFIKFGQNYDIVLDYAHTVNGIKSILETFSNYKRIITVTGSAGGREKEKRSIIGSLVMNMSDISIFTMDDPRFEDVNQIIDEMVGDNIDYIRICDRHDAIFYALDNAKAGDVVLILGKGRDNYMAIGDKKIKYCDYDVIKEYFSK